MVYTKGGKTIQLTPELKILIESIQEKKAEAITVLDLGKVTSFTDYFVLCSADSEPQLKAIFKNIEERMTALGFKPGHVEGRADTGWILMDYDDFVVHIFLREKRSYYDLERLWADAPRMSFNDQQTKIPVAR